MQALRHLSALMGTFLLLVSAVGTLDHDHHAVEVAGSYECTLTHQESAEAPHTTSTHVEAAGAWHQHVCVACQSKTRRSELPDPRGAATPLDRALEALALPASQPRSVLSHTSPPLRGPPSA